jgi:hypothetical protein
MAVRTVPGLPLTGREYEVACPVATGLTNRLIASRLSLSVRTVECHLWYAGASRLVAVGKDRLEVGFEGADPADFAYGTVPKQAPAGDEPAQGGQGAPGCADNPASVHQDDAAQTVYGTQGAVLRSAARRSAGRRDPRRSWSA